MKLAILNASQDMALKLHLNMLKGSCILRLINNEGIVSIKVFKALSKDIDANYCDMIIEGEEYGQISTNNQS